MWILLVDVIAIIALARLLAHLKREGRLSAKRFGVMIAAFWSFVTLSFFLVFGLSNWAIVGLGAGISILQFTVAYFFGVWFYRNVIEEQR